MVEIAFVLVAACVLAIYCSRFVQAPTLPAILAYTTLFAFAALVIWALLLVTNVIPINEIGRRSFGLYTDSLLRWFPVIALLPPSLATLVFAIVLWRQRRIEIDRSVAKRGGRSRNANP